jgi:hypothetical protein
MGRLPSTMPSHAVSRTAMLRGDGVIGTESDRFLDRARLSDKLEHGSVSP